MPLEWGFSFFYRSGARDFKFSFSQGEDNSPIKKTPPGEWSDLDLTDTLQHVTNENDSK